MIGYDARDRTVLADDLIVSAPGIGPRRPAWDVSQNDLNLDANEDEILSPSGMHRQAFDLGKTFMQLPHHLTIALLAERAASKLY